MNRSKMGMKICTRKKWGTLVSYRFKGELTNVSCRTRNVR
jgi:hypothetical protein